MSWRRVFDILSASTSYEETNRFKSFYERAFLGEELTEVQYFPLPVESWAEISYYPIRHDGFVIGAACHSRDITNLKQAEIKVTKSEAFSKDILNSLSSHIAVVNQDGTIVAVNDTWERFAEENGDTLLANTGVGSNYFSVCEKSSESGIAAATETLLGMKNVLNGKTESFYLEYPCDSPTEKRWFGMSVVKFESDETILVVAHQSITERKIAEEELILKNQELQKTNAELDRFVYSASHDLRAPLSSVLGLLNLIEMESKEKETLTYSLKIRNSIHRLDGFIKNILSYSKNNRLELEPKLIMLQQTIQNIVNSLQYMSEAKDIEFEITIDSQEPFYSDAQRFTIVIENLISNAIKFQDFSRLKRLIKISGKCDKDYLHLTIADNGIGIPLEYQPKVFDMFFRISGEHEGSGIGLYIVKETMDKLQGSIQVTSEEHVGTTFSLMIMNLLQQQDISSY